MAEFEVKNYEGQLYLKEDLLRILHSNPLKAIANAEAVILFPKDVPLESVKKSINILLQDIELRIEKQKRENNHPDDIKD